MPIPDWLAVVLTIAAVVGNAYVLMAVVNFLYGERISRSILKPVRLAIGGLVVGNPILLVLLAWPAPHRVITDTLAGYAGPALQVLVGVLVLFGLIVFPVVTAYRSLKPVPKALLAARTETVDLWPIHGAKLRGDGSWRWATYLPFNQVFRLDLTEWTLAVPGLPPAWDGLTVHVVSDLHFVGTPARLYFDELVRRMNGWPVPDVLVLAGDYVDSLTHHRWILPTLGRLKRREAAFALLGNHDVNFRPARVRRRLARIGCHVLGNAWKEVTIRGERCVAVGHEGPWFYPPPDLSNAPADLFRLGVSHTPDNFYWAKKNRVNLLFCGHVHGGQVRVPAVGSIFVPSVYGRRFDCGVFESGGTVMAVNRGVSGKEPIRFRCNAQVLRVTLKQPREASS
jgi:predicted MPP superfamily phosphohydrolase